MRLQVKSVLLVTVIFSAILVLCSSYEVKTEGNVVVGDAEREYEQCQRTCGASSEEEWQWQCQRTCQDAYETALRREREEREREHGGEGSRHRDKEGYVHCLKTCEDKEQGFARQRQCKLGCEQKYRPSKHRRDEDEEKEERRGLDVNKSHKAKEKEESNSPYYFNSKIFETRYSTQEGNMSVLPRFSERSYLLRGIDQFRVGLFHANPNTFTRPHHWDADSVLFVVRGKAVMTLVTQDNRESVSLERGDVLTIPAGTTSYFVSTHSDEKLKIAVLLRPVNNVGEFEQYFGIGGEQTESFLSSFSSEILEAALDVSKDEIDGLFKQRKEGVIIKATDEQVRSMAQSGMSTERFGSLRSSFNLFNNEPFYSNEHGTFYEVSPNDYEKLEKLDVSVAFTVIKQGSMLAPMFNSRKTVIAFVEDGSGYIEMAHPLRKQSNKEHKYRQCGSPKYQKVRFSFSKGDAFVIPAGLPLTFVASENENLRMFGFGINAQKNKMNFLAGQENMINQLDNEAKEMTFEMPGEVVETMFRKQQSSYFVAGPQQQQQKQQQQRQESLFASVSEFAGF